MDRPDQPTRATIVDDAAEAPSDLPPATDRYRVLRRLGKGGMGEVMAVRDDTIGREIALKRIRRNDPSDRMVARFLREAAIQGQLEHPAIVPVHEIGRDAAGLPFFTMRAVAGTTLAKVLDGDRTGYSRQRLLRAFVEVCLAVEFAHKHGVIHRDLKPDNIVLGEFGEVYVLDWGVAKVIGEADIAADTLSGSGSGSGEGIDKTTIPGTPIGTPGYMAPEQAHGLSDVDGRADVYSLGCVLFEILTNVRLEASRQSGVVIDPRPSKGATDVPPELDDLCVEATVKDRDKRIATARELGDRVQRYLDGDRDLELRRRLAAEHLANAQQAFTAEDHTRAMREAASALALDPSLARAAELVGRLMLEPPKVTPPEVLAVIADDDARTAAGNVRVGVSIYVAFLAFTPVLWWVAPSQSPYVLAISLLVILNGVLSWWVARAGVAGRERWLALSNGLLIAVVARGYTPFLIAPALAAMAAMAIQFTPTLSRMTSAAGVVIVTTLAVLAPWVLEQLGVLSQTTFVDERGITLKAAAMGVHEGPALAAAAVYVGSMILAAALLARGMRLRERAARRHLHLQAWQLRQLLAA